MVDKTLYTVYLWETMHHKEQLAGRRVYDGLAPTFDVQHGELETVRDLPV